MLAALMVSSLRSGPFEVSHVDVGQREKARLIDVVPPGPGVLVAGPSLLVDEFASVVTELVRASYRVLLVADADFGHLAARLLVSGASGFVRIEETLDEDLPAAVTSVANGSSALHPDVAAEVLRRWRAERAQVDKEAKPVTLTRRENDVLRGLQEGFTSRRLASSLGVSEKTVESHRSRLYAKLGARNQAHAVRIAYERGLPDGNGQP